MGEEPIEARLARAAGQVEESGPIRVRARLDARLRNSRISWTADRGLRQIPSVEIVGRTPQSQIREIARKPLSFIGGKFAASPGSGGAGGDFGFLLGDSS
jgi:hypothetical protein